ncbi:MAG: glycosyltransferase family 9 protein [Patescibacteria group bacterium]
MLVLNLYLEDNILYDILSFFSLEQAERAMKLTTMRRIDKIIGQPVCFVLSWFYWLFGRLLYRCHHLDGQRCVLFIELSEMGSTILASQAIQRVSSDNPSHPPCFVIFKKNVEGLRLLNLFKDANIFTIRDDSIASLVVDSFRFMLFCRARGIDTAIDLELFTRVSSILSLISCAGTRVGFYNFFAEGLYRGDHLTHRVQYNPYYHMSQNFMALVESLEEDPTDVPMVKRAIPLLPMTCRVPVSHTEYDYMRNELGKFVDLSQQPILVLFNHDAGELLPIRSWPTGHFAELARLLLNWDSRVIVVLVGIESAMESAHEIIKKVDDKRCVSFVGCTRTILDLVQLFHQSSLLVTNDSGPAHFASLTEIPSITLFGPETPQLYGPLGKNKINLFKGLACSPCLTAFNHRNSPCKNNICMQQILPTEVFEIAFKLLSLKFVEK